MNRYVIWPQKVVNLSNVNIEKASSFFVHWHLSGNNKSNFSSFIMQQRPPTYMVTYWILCLTCCKVKKKSRETETRQTSFFLPTVIFTYFLWSPPGLILHEFCTRKLTFWRFVLGHSLMVISMKLLAYFPALWNLFTQLYFMDTNNF